MTNFRLESLLQNKVTPDHAEIMALALLQLHYGFVQKYTFTEAYLVLRNKKESGCHFHIDCYEHLSDAVGHFQDMHDSPCAYKYEAIGVIGGEQSRCFGRIVAQVKDAYVPTCAFHTPSMTGIDHANYAKIMVDDIFTRLNRQLVPAGYRIDINNQSVAPAVDAFFSDLGYSVTYTDNCMYVGHQKQENSPE